MRGPLLRSAAPVALLLLGAGSAASPPPEDAIVVTGQRIPIIVNGRVQRCRPLANDPQDRSHTKAPLAVLRRQSILLPKSDGSGFKLVDDDESAAGSGVWRRVGTGIDQYVFRAPQDGSVLCIGSKYGRPEGYGQLRQMIEAKLFRGKRVRFTAWVASRQAREVRFWLTAIDPTEPWVHLGTPNAQVEDAERTGGPYVDNPGDPKQGWIYNGGNTNPYAWGGSHGWTPVLIEMGPVSRRATLISFGFLLQGAGDVWLYDPKIEAVPANDPNDRWGSSDIFVIGRDVGRLWLCDVACASRGGRS